MPAVHARKPGPLQDSRPVGQQRSVEIYRARDTKLGRTVTIKVLPQDISRSLALRSQILADARAATALSHPNIAALYEVGEEGDFAYLACEYVPGEPLTARHRQPLAQRPARHRFCHPAGRCGGRRSCRRHRAQESQADHRHRDAERESEDSRLRFSAWMKRPGATLPPLEDADFRADPAALGAILYEMVTGRQAPPSAPPPPSATNSHIPKELDHIVIKALNKSGDEQYESAATLAAELRSVAAVLDVRSGDREPPTNVPPRSEKRSREFRPGSSSCSPAR